MVEVIERGDIAFFVKPRVQAADERTPAKSPDGVQRFFLVLGAGRHHRRLRIGRNRMPARRGQRFWACVERVGTLDHVVADQLEAETYSTKTRGERYQPPARPVAHGEYALVRHDTHAHLVYRVDHTDDAARDLAVADRGSFVLLFKRRRGRAVWTADADPTLALDTEDAELVLVGGGEADDHETAVAAAFANG